MSTVYEIFTIKKQSTKFFELLENCVNTAYRLNSEILSLESCGSRCHIACAFFPHRQLFLFDVWHTGPTFHNFQTNFLQFKRNFPVPIIMHFFSFSLKRRGSQLSLQYQLLWKSGDKFQDSVIFRWVQFRCDFSGFSFQYHQNEHGRLFKHEIHFLQIWPMGKNIRISDNGLGTIPHLPKQKCLV